METVCFSKILLIKQISGFHIHTIILENDHHLKLLQTVYWKLFLFGGAPCIKSHSYSLNRVITNSVTGPPEYKHFLYWHLMMETGPALETLCLIELKRMDTVQNIIYAGIWTSDITNQYAVSGCKISCMQLVMNIAVLCRNKVPQSFPEIQYTVKPA
jgi:hypothetical protein